MCNWTLNLIFKAKLNSESGNWKIQYGHQAAILKVTSLKINRLWPMATNKIYEIWNWNSKANLSYAPKTMPPTDSRYRKIQYGHWAAILKVTLMKIDRLLSIATKNMHMKFEIEIPKQTWVTLRKPCFLQTDGWTDQQTYEVNPVYPPNNFLGQGYNDKVQPTNFEPFFSILMSRKETEKLYRFMAGKSSMWSALRMLQHQAICIHVLTKYTTYPMPGIIKPALYNADLIRKQHSK